MPSRPIILLIAASLEIDSNGRAFLQDDMLSLSHKLYQIWETEGRCSKQEPLGQVPADSLMHTCITSRLVSQYSIF